MYNINDKFFYEILEDYKESDNKDEIFNIFCDLIWNSDNKRIVFTDYIKFNTEKCFDMEYKNVFDKYSQIQYINFNRKCENTDYVSLLRQKINNIYSLNCDKDVYLKSNYMNLLKTAKDLYFKFISKDEKVISLLPKEIDNIITNSLYKANEIKSKFTYGRPIISWNNYQQLMNGYMRKCFDNYIPISIFENKNEFVLDIDLWTEDNYCVKYFCKSLDKYFKNYEKEYFGVRQKKEYKECIKCGGLVEINNKSDICGKCKNYRMVEYKKIKCIDCNVEFQIKTLNSQTNRCAKCYEIYRRKYKTKKDVERYHKNKYI